LAPVFGGVAVTIIIRPEDVRITIRPPDGESIAVAPLAPGRLRCIQPIEITALPVKDGCVDVTRREP
jgi:hypothetical protein